jgi:hypothetical protein
MIVLRVLDKQVNGLYTVYDNDIEKGRLLRIADGNWKFSPNECWDAYIIINGELNREEAALEALRVINFSKKVNFLQEKYLYKETLDHCIDLV